MTTFTPLEYSGKQLFESEKELITLKSPLSVLLNRKSYFLHLNTVSSKRPTFGVLLKNSGSKLGNQRNRGFFAVITESL
jgi:hypothetical protein